MLATRGRLAADLGSASRCSASLSPVIGLVAATPVRARRLAIVGLGNSIVDINALTIMQRAVPDDVLARVLGVLEGILLGSIGLGGLLAPL